MPDLEKADFRLQSRFEPSGDQGQAIRELITVNGDVIYEGTVQDGGRYLLSSHNGNITFAVPQGSNATLSVATFAGEFEADFPVTLTEASSGGKRFSFVLGSGSARVELESFGGTIHLRRP